MSKYIFLDFNGTIIDDVDLCLDLLNDILRNQNKRLVTKEQYKDIFTFPVKKYYELAGIDFSIEPFESLADKFIVAYQPASLKCGLYPNSVEAFQKLKMKGYHLVILSASERNNLLEQCESFGIVPYFDAILGIDNIHAASKVGIALKFMEENHIKGKDVLFVGDTLHDLEVAKAMGARCMLVACGHQSTNVLKQGGVPILPNVYALVELLEDVE
ncbi:MAG: HAD hydrolase-like protein [Roseburia sp.]|nr:HAD hydrolase-like protein [Anaeroplasma bactoclasticum]MCM1196096.1 HAD hydrolase-like protein [Roseburia sp.]MCM1557336.1 HAD hydrolase-like protein [Anaeroplasma bactoclasticum]